MSRRTNRLKAFARSMRRDPTPAEARLWARLRHNQLGVRFRRQEPIGPFIADFACTTARIVIELDGDSHEDLGRDLRRDRWLHERGWFVLHFDNGDVMMRIDETLALIDLALEDPGSIPDPQNLDPGLGGAT